MKKTYWIIAAVIVLLGLGYIGRHKIRALLSGAYSSPSTSSSVPSYQAPSSAPTAGIDVIMTKTNAAGVKVNYLAGPNGMTLYIFDKDTSGKSNCYGTCATTWPPYTTSSAMTNLPTNIGTTTRTDGAIQYSYKGMPLYYYAADSQPGDMTGDGFGGIWHIVKI